MSARHRTNCTSPGKAPLITGWPKRDKTTAAELDIWISQWPHANPGLPLGSVSGLVGVDVDGEIGEKLLQEYSQGDLPETWEFTTGAGRRLLYRLPPGVVLKKHSQSDRTREHEELALLGEGQQTVIPPAIHSSGREYRWTPGRDPFTFGPAAMAPIWMINIMSVKKITPIDEARSKRDKKSIPVSNPAEALEKLQEKCHRFKDDWKQQRDGILDEETWFKWISLLVAAGYPNAAEYFSGTSPKHDQRSIDRLSKLIQRQEEDPLPPVRCSSFGCTKEIIGTCHKKIRVNRDKEITNSPAAFIMTRSQAVRRYFRGNQFISKRLGDHLLEDYYFLFSGQNLYFYEGGVYVDGGADLVRQQCRERLRDEFRKDRVNEVIYYIETATMHDTAKLNTRHGLINVKNGLLNWKTGEILPHDPKYLCTIQIPAIYNPRATCPKTNKFWSDVLPPDCIETVEEIFGYSMVPSTKLQKAFMFTGTGSNGKGTLIDQLSAFIGGQSISNVPLQDLADHRFKRAEIFGKLLNLFADLDSRALQSTSYFKMIVAGDEIDAERKHKDPFFFRPFARLLFSANELPRTTDQSFAYFRRWIIIPFERRFIIGETADTALIGKITTEQELSGVLNRALTGLRRLDKTQRFTQPKATEQALEAYRLANDSAAGFIDECCVTSANVWIKKVKLYNNYKNWCQDFGLRPLSNRRFYARILELFPNIVESRPTGGDRLFYGIGLEANEVFNN